MNKNYDNIYLSSCHYELIKNNCFLVKKSNKDILFKCSKNKPYYIQTSKNLNYKKCILLNNLNE